VTVGTGFAHAEAVMKRAAFALVALGVLAAASGCSQEEDKPAMGMVEVKSPEIADQTLDYLHDHKAELKMRAPREELTGFRTIKDDLAMTHVRFRQTERGLRVLGGNAMVHYDAAGGITKIDQDYVPDLDRLDIVPTIDKDQAKTFINPGEQVIGEPELMIYAFNHHDPTLAWEMSVRSSVRSSWTVRIDAHTGEQLSRITQQHTATGTGVGVSGKTRTIQYTTGTSGQLQLVDATRAFQLATFDAKQAPDATKGTVVIGSSASSWDTASTLGRGSAVDAQANIAFVVDYYSKKFARKSWDDKNGNIPIVVHVGDDTDGQPGLDNAYFDQQLNLMAFGDGRELLKPTAGFMDITAHEFTHAVTFNSSALEYQDQSGALNEGISDIFGAFIEHAQTPDDKNNWLMGEGSLLQGSGAMRDMVNPKNGFDPQPGHMTEFVRTTQDQGGVHINSGIPNKAASLMTVGGTGTTGVVVARGIGWENAEKVWYRANTVYLKETSDFAAAAQATLTAGKDLGLSQEDQNVIDCAWKAVGVTQGTCAKITPASTTPGTSGTADSSDSTSSETSGDDDDDSSTSTSKKKKKKTTAPAQTAGCSTTGGSGDATWLWALAAGAVVMSRRRRQR
jgi:MYXO-CTERM domain-containing protein